MAISFRHLLVPVDFGAPGQRAVDTAVALAERFDAQITLVHVFEAPAYVYAGMVYATADLFAPIEQAAREQLDKKLAEVKTRVPNVRGDLRRGPAAQGILAAIEELHPDLVVMGTHGRKGVSHALIGSVAEKIVRMSPVPVLTIRDGAG
jgi:nucleotide-binding universal stress UspA family protein